MNLKISYPIVIFFAGIILTSCVTYQRQPITSIHSYEVLVKDINGQPIEGAEIDYVTEGDHKEYDRGKFTTKSDGKIILRVSHTDYYAKEFTSKLTYKINKEGHYTISGSEEIFYVSDKTLDESVVLLKPIDYIDPNFLSSNEGIALKVNILRFIDLIRLQSLLADADLKPETINLIKFKENKYLQFTFTSGTVYNSLRMNKYDIGKRLFDEVVRKVLNPLNEYISIPKTFYGYDLKVIGHTKDFSDKYSSRTPIEYRFIMPEEIVRKYKNKDISGQQVLDSSIILMDDERIELKLQ